MLVRARDIRINRSIAVAVVAGALCLFPVLALAGEPIGPDQAPEEAASHETAPQHGETSQTEDEAHGESPWRLVAMLVNFAVLVGGLYYFLRAPFAGHLVARAEGVRSALDQAEATRTAASAQLAEVEAKLQALPGEIEALRQRGVEEIAAEEARIQRAAEGERQRLIVQARREIDLALRVAKQELVEHAATLAVDAASAHLRASMTPVDQERLLTRYVAHVRQPHD